MDKKALLADFEHKKYGFVDDASIQVCEWNKKALRGEGKCYKQDFYGVHCVSCHQMTPLTFWCNNSCIFCWRPKEYMKTNAPKGAAPKEIIEGLIKRRAKLISGFGGHEGVPKEKFAEGLEQRHWAISLSGEPTLYKELPKLVRQLKERKGTETIFIVTNGQNPSMIMKMWKEDSLPTQLYVSMVAPREELYRKITCNREKSGWKNYLKSLSSLALLPTRSVIRLTLIKGKNDSPKDIEEFAELLEAVQSDFVEVKAYMWLGFSRKRLAEENMPYHEYVKEFAGKLLLKMPSYHLEAEKTDSRILLLKKNSSKYKTKIIDRD
ncbi:MAG: 4-demethylwyosine synthase TYW1 [archaeon]